ncbi:MAG: M20/M25/M40 family metallo-hydrolase [candidate division WOR-3 bacterium]
MNYIYGEQKQKEILSLAMELIKIPAISVGRFKNPEGVVKCFEFIVAYLKKAGLRVIELKDKESVPALYCDLQTQKELSGRILFAGHYDRVSPISETQMVPFIEGEWLKARGATDMLCTVATLMVLFKDLKLENKKINCGLILVGNEESGETERWGTPFILEELYKTTNYQPDFVIVAERTGEGDVCLGRLEYKNRGLIRIKIVASGSAEHTAQLKGLTALERIMEFRNRIFEYFSRPSESEWKTTFTFPYFLSGEIGNFNTTPTVAWAGLEVRPIPEENIEKIITHITELGKQFDLSIEYINKEPGITTPLKNSFLQSLLQILATFGGGKIDDYLGKGKIHATQARFIKSPVVILGQSGINPHGAHEAHYIPSIMPYYHLMREFLSFCGSA